MARTKGSGTKPPKDETKSQKFVRLANARTSKAIKAIRAVGKLGAPNYERTQAQVDSIVSALKAEVVKANEFLTPRPAGSKEAKAQTVFTLPA